MTTATTRPPASDPVTPPRPRRRRGAPSRENLAGWLFVAPALAGLLVFLVLPILMALYISFTKWSGGTDPLAGGAQWVGLDNYKRLLVDDMLTRENFAVSVRNNFYFVLLVVPIQTLLALFLATLVNQRMLKGKGFFRTAFYFPSVTSSIAITIVFIFLFQGSGAVNAILGAFGISGPNWLADSRGVFHVILGGLGVDSAPSWLSGTVFSLSWWDWLSGPSVALCVIIILVIWTTSGTFMIMFLAALQNVPEEVYEAADIDGATSWTRFWKITVPLLRPAIALVITLGLIGSWQIFDQIYLTGNNPATSTPAYLSYKTSFQDGAFGVGAAIAFLLFVLIMVLTVIQRRLIKEDLTT